MFVPVAWALLALSLADGPITVAAQEVPYQFTMGVASPAPVPGKPFTLTWTGGNATEVVYIILNYNFPDTPNQNIPYITTDILSNAPNNGSWTYNVPLNIEQGRYSFSIGQNPFLISDTSGIFTILASQTSYVPPAPATTNTAFQSYNGCGLPPLVDYTYTGYQPPCTVTSNGHVETLYPIVPISDSTSFFGGSYSVSATATDLATLSPTSGISSSSSPLFNTAFATGIYAQALQCLTPVMPTNTMITAGGTTTIFSMVSCTTASGSNDKSGGVCHTSGYTTISVNGTSSVCCPNGWVTTPLNLELFCFTSMEQVAKRGTVEERQASTETLAASPYPLVEISGLAFTIAGIVTGEAIVATGSSPNTSGSRSAVSISTATGSATSANVTKSSGLNLDHGFRRAWGIVAAMIILYSLV